MTDQQLWTQAEAQRLHELWTGGMTAARIAKVMGRTYGAVKGRIARHEAPRCDKLWGLVDDERLRAMWGTMSLTDIGRQMGRSRQRVRHHAKRLGLPWDHIHKGGANRKAAKRETRPCLNCHKPFKSEGKGNRLCSSCGSQSYNPMSPW